MTPAVLTSLLAQRVMGWEAAPNRFLLGNKRWRPRWRFQPLERIEDAIKLLDAACPDGFTICAEAGGPFYVTVRIAGVFGDATHALKARAIAVAVSKSIGIDEPLEEEQHDR